MQGGYDGIPVAPPQQPQPPMPPTPPAGDQQAPPQASNATSASFVVKVPADAQVFVNDLATKSTGAERRYTSRGLLPGHTYTFNVRVEYVRDGKPVTETKVVRLTAGSTDELAFGTDRAPQQEQVAETGAATKLTVRVPENAKVFLSERETHQTGAVREYVTTRLAPGTEWQDYVVRVTIERDGQVLSQERSITLVGGEAQQLEFAFDQAEVATTLAAAR